MKATLTVGDGGGGGDGEASLGGSGYWACTLPCGPCCFESLPKTWWNSHPKLAAGGIRPQSAGRGSFVPGVVLRLDYHMAFEDST